MKNGVGHEPRESAWPAPKAAPPRRRSCYTERLEHIELFRGAWLAWHTAWLESEGARELEATLAAELAWEQRHIVLFGKRILQPRLIAWAGELPYRYSGQTLEPRPWSEALRVVLARVNATAGVDFNHVLVNRYRDGRDSMGYHADAEPELGPDPVVATLSLGAERRFALRRHDKHAGEPLRVLPLRRGSLLIMGGTCQQHYRHAILREGAEPVAERISLTFRQLLAAPGQAKPGPRARES